MLSVSSVWRWSLGYWNSYKGVNKVVWCLVQSDEDIHIVGKQHWKQNPVLTPKNWKQMIEKHWKFDYWRYISIAIGDSAKLLGVLTEDTHTVISTTFTQHKAPV